MYQGPNGGWKKEGARSFSVRRPAYFHQWKEIYLYVRVEKNSVETESYFTWHNPWWSLIGKWRELWGFYQLPMPSSASDLVFQDCNSARASGLMTYPSQPGRALRFSRGWAFVASSRLWALSWSFSRKARIWMQLRMLRSPALLALLTKGISGQ